MRLTPVKKGRPSAALRLSGDVAPERAQHGDRPSQIGGAALPYRRNYRNLAGGTFDLPSQSGLVEGQP